jgi:ketosteroid isomerase-like protein
MRSASSMASLVAALTLAALAVCARAAPARADVATEVTAQFRSFVTGLGTGAPDTDGLEVFITPFNVLVSPTAADLSDQFALFTGARVANVTVVPSASGKAAWLVADVTAHMPDLEGTGHHDEVVRASAFLSQRDDHHWWIGALHWSQAFPDIAPAKCEPDEPMHFGFMIPKNLYEEVEAVLDAIAGGKLAALQSDDRRAIAIGSAPKQRFTGGAAIKAVLKKWHLGAAPRDSAHRMDAFPAVTGNAWSGDLMWVVTSVRAAAPLCADYRALFVLAREANTWKIVHQHYSVPFPKL